jgi:PAS domain S-box-containing protein
MFKKPWGQSKIRLLLVDGDVANVEAACKALESSDLSFAIDAAFDGKVALEKLTSKRYDCLLIDPDVLNRIGHNVREALAMAGPEAALVVLCHSQRPHQPRDLTDLTGVTFLDKEALRGPGLAERISECLEVDRAMKNGEIDALLVPIAGTTSPLLAAGADGIYRVLVETLQEGIITADPDGTILFTNRRTGEILGCDPDRLLGLNVLALADPEDRPWIEVKIDEALRGTASRCELGLACPRQAPVYVLVSLGLVEDTGGGG